MCTSQCSQTRGDTTMSGTSVRKQEPGCWGQSDLQSPFPLGSWCPNATCVVTRRGSCRRVKACCLEPKLLWCPPPISRSGLHSSSIHHKVPLPAGHCIDEPAMELVQRKHRSVLGQRPEGEAAAALRPAGNCIQETYDWISNTFGGPKCLHSRLV